MHNNTQAGFTFIELLVVMGIVSVLASAFLFIDINSYRADAFRAKRSALVTELQTARADAMNNIDQQPHKVLLNSDGYEFASDSPSEIIFEQLSGDANYDGDITLIDPNTHKKLTISINHEGRIQ